MKISAQRKMEPLDATEAANVLKVNSRTLVRWARCGYVPAHPLGEGKRRIWRFFENELLEWVKEQETNFSAKQPGSTFKAAINAHAEEIA